MFLLRPLCAKMDGRGREEIAAAGRNSWTSDRLPDESSGVCVKIKRKEREGPETEFRVILLI